MERSDLNLSFENKYLFSSSPDLQRCLEDFDSLFALPSGGLLTEEEANSTRVTLCETGALFQGEISVSDVGDPLLEHVRYSF